jgi:hypothetical protein
LQQSNELRIFPPSSTNPTTLKQDKGSNSVPVVHDTLAHGPSSTVTTLNARHPLESQVKNWNAQQEQLKLELAKRLGGIGEVVRIGTEKMIVSNVRPAFVVGMSCGANLGDRIFDLLLWGDRRMFISILSMGRIRRLISGISIMVTFKS